jgi:catechol 2,3-dioxygenase-like lactoylglutathione lyase family enzyme
MLYFRSKINYYSATFFGFHRTGSLFNVSQTAFFWTDYNQSRGISLIRVFRGRESIMIIGLSHIGLTVGDMEETLRFYGDIFGCEVLSDAERKGEILDQITGIPGFHSRTVYLAFYPPCHIEAFAFFHPPTLPRENPSKPQVGISYLVLQGSGTGSPGAERKENWMSPLPEAPSGAFQTVLDPNGQTTRVITDEKETLRSDALQSRLLYPVLLVESIEDSLKYYRDVLGFKVENEDRETYSQGPSKKEMRWVILKGISGGECLKLISLPSDSVLKAGPWKMQKIGFTHVAFAVQGMSDYYQEMVHRKVNFKSAPTSVMVGPHQGGKAVYLTTPEGVTLEFIDSPLTKNEIMGC